MDKIQLGSTPAGHLALKLETLQRHFACFGSSGSGKTVACKVLIEELAMRGIPIIAFDPQGDIASLALTEEADIVEKYGKIYAFGASTKGIRDIFSNNVEVLVWTPGSSK